MRPARLRWTVVASIIASTSQAIAQAPSPAAPAQSTTGPPLDPERMEYAGFPIIGGNTDIGVEFGAAATITRFHDGVTPYLWNTDILVAPSLKSDSQGLRFVQQKVVLRLDAPALAGGRLRVDSRASFDRIVNAGYYGIGNSTPAGAASGSAIVGNRYQYLFEELRNRTIVRYKTGTPIDLAFGGIARWESPSAQDGTKLAEDASRVFGLSPTVLGTLSSGLIFDTRDTEFITTRGLFWQLGVGGTVGTSHESIRYGEAAAVLSQYVSLFGPLVFAQRIVASFQFGRVPFYDLAQGGVFEPQRLFGGESGVRGVPQGRYSGLVKFVSNSEVRAPGPRFSFLGQRLRLGATAFVDVGRVYADYTFHAPDDGSGPGLKVGVGGGLFLQWGEAAIFRLDVAWSPDARAENPGLPVGIYVADGLQF